MKRNVSERTSLLIAFMLTLGLFKLWMTSNIPIMAIPAAGYDDGLMVRIAESIRNFHWLGGYSDTTLVKGPFFPFFLALCNWLHIPFLDAQTIFYMLGCMTFTFGCADLFKTKKVLYLLYGALLFNPVSFSCETFQRVYRNGIVMAQGLIVLGCIIAVYLKRSQSVKKLIPWMIWGGIGLTTMWYTRDDSIWIMPFTLVALVVTAGLIIREEGIRKNRKTWKKLAVLLLPFFMMWGAKTLISTINYKLYNIYTVTETSGTNFAKAIKSIYSVKCEVDIPCASVTREKLQRIYEVCPTLGEISEVLERNMDNWQQGDGEVRDGWFYWVLRQTVAECGYYADGATSEEFYGKVHEEIEVAKEEGRLEYRRTMPSALMSPWREEYGEQLPATMKMAHEYVISYTMIGIAGGEIPSSSDGGGGIAWMETMTGERAIHPLDENSSEEEIASQNAYIESIQEPLGVIDEFMDMYILLGPILFKLSMICLGILCLQMIFGIYKKRFDKVPVFLVSIGLILSYIVILGGVSYTHISAYGAVAYMYLSGAYPVVLTFEGILILFELEALVRFMKKYLIDGKIHTRRKLFCK